MQFIAITICVSPKACQMQTPKQLVVKHVLVHIYQSWSLKLMMMSWIKKLLIHIKILLSFVKGLLFETIASVVANGTAIYVTFAQTENLSSLFFLINLLLSYVLLFCFFSPTSNIHVVYLMCTANSLVLTFSSAVNFFPFSPFLNFKFWFLFIFPKFPFLLNFKLLSLCYFFVAN